MLCTAATMKSIIISDAVMQRAVLSQDSKRLSVHRGHLFVLFDASF